MYLVAMHYLKEYPGFIEGFHEKYNCITLWKDVYGFTASGTPFFTYSADTRVGKYTNPFK